MRAIRVETALGSWMENRNGMPDIRAITATQYSNDFIGEAARKPPALVGG